MSEPVATPALKVINGDDVAPNPLYDYRTERALVAWALRDPSRRDELFSLGIELADFWDGQARDAWKALCNASPPTLDGARAQLQADHDRRGPHRAGEELADTDWLDRIMALGDKPAALVKGWTESLKRFRAKREAAIVEAEERRRREAIEPPHPAECEDEPLTPTWHSAPSLVEQIMQRAGEGFTPHTLGGEEIYRLRTGGVAMLMGAPGTGKTSMGIGVAIEHARERGPAIIFSLEMDADEVGARGIGMQCDESWEGVLCGAVRREFMEAALALPRLQVLDGDNATLRQLGRAVLAMRAAYPGEPILVVIDYLQIMPGDDREVRARVSAAAQAVRRLAKRLRVLVLAISQPSRAAGRALSAGELIGGDSMTAGAESAEIERSAYITLALGASGAERPDGSRVIDLSIGKARFGGGDRVVPVAFWGRSGRMRLAGEARPAGEVKAERETQRDQRHRDAAELAIVPLLDRSPEPMSATQIRKAIGGTREVICAAVRALLASGAIVRCGQARGGVAPVWTPNRARDAGLAAEVGDA